MSNEDGMVEYSTACRFLAKLVSVSEEHDCPEEKEIDYEWLRMTFIWYWQPDDEFILLCFVPDRSKDVFQNSLTKTSHHSLADSAFRGHAMLLEGVVQVFDQSVWSFVKLVRTLEKRRPSVQDKHIDYGYMHELARHVIHSSEMLEMALKVVDHILIEGGELERTILPEKAKRSSPAINAIRLQKTILECLHLRSRALEDRLRNEINLVRPHFHVE